MDRREFLTTVAAGIVLLHNQEKTTPMYGLIGKMNAAPGQRDAVIAILLEGTAKMTGCLSYIVAKDTIDANAIWITEVWDTEANHKASLALPAVQAASARARPMIVGFGERFITTPLGGVGLLTGKQ